MLKITMFSSAETVPGQGVGSAYRELVNLLKDRFADKFEVKINQLGHADISHYHTINFGFYLNTFLPGRGRKIGYVHFLPETLDGSIKLIWPFKQIFYQYVLAFYRRMDHIVVVNPTFIPKLEAAGIPAKDVTYIPNFVTKDEFYPLTLGEKKNFRQQLGYQVDDYIILGVGQVQERKGIFDFIQLARDNPQWEFIWTGGFSFGGITAGYEELKKVIANPPANLKFPGIVDRSQMNNYYNLADVFLLPSFNELFPMSALEAFSAGTPTILRDLELYKEILAGYYLAATDREAMQIQLQQLQSDPKLQQEMSDQALEASKRYSKDYVAGLWDNFYQEQAERK